MLREMLFYISGNFLYYLRVIFNNIFCNLFLEFYFMFITYCIFIIFLTHIFRHTVNMPVYLFFILYWLNISSFIDKRQNNFISKSIIYCIFINISAEFS